MKRKQPSLLILFNHANPGCLPVASRAGAAVFISDKKSENDFMSTAADGIQISGCEIICVANIKCIADIHAKHGGIAVLVTIAAPDP